MLLDEVVATQPYKMIPVVHLILHLGHVRLSRTVPYSLSMEIGPGEQQVANQTVVNLADGLNMALCVPQMMADRDIEALFLGLLIGRFHNAIAGCVHGDRFFQKHVPSGLDRRGELHGAETRRRAKQDNVGAGRDRFLECVETHEPAARRYIDPVMELLLEILMGALDRLGKRIGHGDEPDVAVRLVTQRSRTRRPCRVLRSRPARS